MIHPKECWNCGRSATTYGQHLTETPEGEVVLKKSVPLCEPCAIEALTFTEDHAND